MHELIYISFAVQLYWQHVVNKQQIKTHGNVLCGQESWHATPCIYEEDTPHHAYMEERKCSPKHTILHYSCPPGRVEHKTNLYQPLQDMDIQNFDLLCFLLLKP